MNKLTRILMAILFLAGLQGQTWAMTAQQEKMKNCNAEAKKKELKGDERKSFMKGCLSSKKKESAKAPQQEK